MKQNYNNIYAGWRNSCRYLIESKLSWCSSGPKFNTKISYSNQDKKAAYHLYRIRQITKFLDLPAKKTLISSLVMSQLDYANAIFILIFILKYSSVGRAADLHVTGPGFNTHS